MTCEAKYSESGALCSIDGCAEYDRLLAENVTLRQELDVQSPHRIRLYNDLVGATEMLEPLHAFVLWLSQRHAHDGLTKGQIIHMADRIVTGGKWQDDHVRFDGRTAMEVLEAENEALRQERDALADALCESQLESGTHQFHRMRGIEMNNRLLDDLDRGLDVRVDLYEERARLRSIIAPLLQHADRHDYAPPLKFSVADCREIKESLNGK